MNHDIISIIIPTYNRSDLIGETLESLLAQTNSNWECIIVDDFSTDNTRSVVEHFIARSSNFEYLNRKSATKGANTCRNEGLGKAQGEYVIFLDSDDLLHADRIQEDMSLIRENPNLDAVIHRSEYFSNRPGDGNLHNERFIETSLNDLDRFLCCDSPWRTSSATWKRTFVEKIGGWPNDLPGRQDWEFHIRALCYKPNYIKRESIGYYIRWHRSANRISNLVAFQGEMLSRATDHVIAALSINNMMTLKRRNGLLGQSLTTCFWLTNSGHPRKGLSLWQAQTKKLGCPIWINVITTSALALTYVNNGFAKVLSIIIEKLMKHLVTLKKDDRS